MVVGVDGQLVGHETHWTRSRTFWSVEHCLSLTVQGEVLHDQGICLYNDMLQLVHVVIRLYVGPLAVQFERMVQSCIHAMHDP